jgi:polysaccharide pyruvyl transferase WcaK-like protein
MSDSTPEPRLRALVLGDTSAAPHHGCELVMANLRRGLADAGVDIVLEHTGKAWQADPRVVSALPAVDLLVINGEGTMHHDRPQGYDFVEAAEVAARSKVPAYLVNCTWQQNSPKLAERAQVFRKIHVRESQSAAELAQVNTSSVVTPDLTLATDWTISQTARRGWLVTDSTMTDVTRELLDVSRHLSGARFIPVIASECPKLGWARQVKRTVQKYAARVLSPLGVLTSYVSLDYALPSARAFLDEMARCEAMLTGRFHAVCFAILTGTPFLALRSNSSKIESLMRDAGLSPDRIVDRGTSAKSLEARLAECQFSPEEEQLRSQYLQAARSAIRTMLAAIADDARSCR